LPIYQTTRRLISENRPFCTMIIVPLTPRSATFTYLLYSFHHFILRCSRVEQITTPTFNSA